MSTIILLVCTVCAVVAIDRHLARRTFRRKKTAPAGEFELFDDQAAILASGDTCAPVQGFVHHTRFNLPEPEAAGWVTARVPSGGSVGRNRRKRRTFARAFAFRSNHRSQTHQGSDRRWRRLAH